MKKMSIDSQIKTNAGSVRCNRCGLTFWHVADCKAHVKYTHGSGWYTWYRSGPYGRYTLASEHRGVIGGGFVR